MFTSYVHIKHRDEKLMKMFFFSVLTRYFICEKYQITIFGNLTDIGVKRLFQLENLIQKRLEKYGKFMIYISFFFGNFFCPEYTKLSRRSKMCFFCQPFLRGKLI